MLWLLLSCAGSGGLAQDSGAPEDRAPLVVRTPCVSDVAAGFDAIAAVGHPEPLSDASVFRDDSAWHYTFTEDNGYGVDNHLQGVAALGDWRFISGGDVRRERADLLVGHVREGLLARVDLGAGAEWHAGGVGRLDTWLAVPTENLRGALGPRAASIRIVDLSRPRAVSVVAIVPLAPRDVAHAATLVRHAGALWLGVWDDHTLGLYEALGASPADGFETTPALVFDRETVEVGTEEVGSSGVSGQAVSLISQCDGALYAIFTDSTSDLPLDGGVDHADLLLLDTSAASWRIVASRALTCPADQGCNFRGGASVDVTEAAELRLVSVPLFRRGDSQVTPSALFGPSGSGAR